MVEFATTQFGDLFVVVYCLEGRVGVKKVRVKICGEQCGGVRNTCIGKKL